MRYELRIAAGIAGLATLGLLASEATASGVGASIYVPGKPQPQATVQQTSCQTGACGPHADCSGCQRLGFACVDHATVPPCTAEGACYPKRNTFGFHATKWRRWPGANYGGPAPEAADPLGDLPAIEPPTAAEEDKSSPPPIEDAPSGEDEGDANGGFEPPTPQPPAFNRELPGMEIDLPPLPEVDGPGFRPGRPTDGAPPSLPFGAIDPRGGAAPSGGEGWRPPRPSFGTSPAILKKAANGDNPPPALPAGFTSSNPSRILRRLPATLPAGRYDGSVQQASAYQPVR